MQWQIRASDGSKQPLYSPRVVQHHSQRSYQNRFHFTQNHEIGNFLGSGCAIQAAGGASVRVREDFICALGCPVNPPYEVNHQPRWSNFRSTGWHQTSRERHQGKVSSWCSWAKLAQIGVKHRPMLLFGRKHRPSGRPRIDVRRSGLSSGDRRRRRKRPCRACGRSRRRGWEENIRGSGSADLLNRRCAISALGGPWVVPRGGEPAAARAGPGGAIKMPH
jgi:hypothetical protein